MFQLRTKPNRPEDTRQPRLDFGVAIDYGSAALFESEYERMAHHKQALKRQRQSEQKRARNQSVKSRMKSTVKKAVAETKNASAKTEAFRQAESEIRHVAQKGVIPKKRASRKVSRLARRLLSA